MVDMEKELQEEEGFDLPTVEGAKVVKPRISVSDAVCTNCEG